MPPGGRIEFRKTASNPGGTGEIYGELARASRLISRDWSARSTSRTRASRLVGGRRRAFEHHFGLTSVRRLEVRLELC